VAVVEDHPLYREALSRTIEAHPPLRLVAAVDSLEALEGRLQQASPGSEVHWPEVVLLDLHLPGMSGVSAITWLVRRGCGVLVVSAARSRSQVLTAFDAGARGYLTKGAEAQVIVEGVRTVAGGGTVVDASIAGHVVGAIHNNRGSSLTERERQVVTLLASGRTDREIARAMTISTRTVHTHLDRIRTKTGIRRRTEMARMALELGLVSDPTY
jgi:DNA-binding NarL/FixJ family response regulator